MYQPLLDKSQVASSGSPWKSFAAGFVLTAVTLGAGHVFLADTAVPATVDVTRSLAEEAWMLQADEEARMLQADEAWTAPIEDEELDMDEDVAFAVDAVADEDADEAEEDEVANRELSGRPPCSQGPSYRTCMRNYAAAAAARQQRERQPSPPSAQQQQQQRQSSTQSQQQQRQQQQQQSQRQRQQRQQQQQQQVTGQSSRGRQQQQRYL